MNIDLKSDKLCFQTCVFKRRFTKEETVEVIVPDAQPDVLRILDTDGTVYLRGKDCEAGRVTVSGVAELAVLYVPESGKGVRRVNVEAPFSAFAESDAITADCLITAKLRLIACDARTVNPRKLVVRVEVAAEAALYLPETVYRTAPREQEGVYYQTESLKVCLPVAVNEKSFVFTDEASLPASAPAIGELLRTTVGLTVESVKPVGGRAVVKGSAVTTLLYESRDDGALCRELIATPFSQIVETDAPGDAADFELALCLTGAHVSRGYTAGDGGEALNLEIHAVAQCVAYGQCELESVTDVYSTKHPLEAQRSGLELSYLDGASETVSETLRATVPVSGEVEKIHAVTARLASSGVREGPEGPVWSAVAAVTVLYSEPGGEVLSAFKRVELERPLEAGQELDAAVGPEIFTAAADGAVEARAPLELTTLKKGRATVDRVESVELDENETLDLTALPNVTVTRAGSRSLWDLARAHMSTVSRIREANALAEDASPEPGSVLLIPRC